MQYNRVQKMHFKKNREILRIYFNLRFKNCFLFNFLDCKIPYHSFLDIVDIVSVYHKYEIAIIYNFYVFILNSANFMKQISFLLIFPYKFAWK